MEKTMETKSKHIKRTIGYVRDIPEDAEKTRTVKFVISKATRDRHGTVLDLDGWDLRNFNANPVIGYQHNIYGDSWFTDPNPDFIIGKGKAYIDQEEKALIGEVKFEPKEINDLAEKIFQKILFGSLRATSVGFLPIGKGKYGEGDESVDGKIPTYYYGKRELLEYSIVNIPSNPDALKRTMEEQKEMFYDLIRETFGEQFTREVVDKMTIGQLMNEKEEGNKELTVPISEYIMKMDLDILKLNENGK